MEKYYPYIISGIVFIISTITAAILKKWTDELLPTLKSMKERWQRRKDYYLAVTYILLDYLVISFLLLSSSIPFNKFFIFFLSLAVSFAFYILINFRFKILAEIRSIQRENTDLQVKTAIAKSIILFDDLADATEKVFESLPGGVVGLPEFKKTIVEIRSNNLKEIQEIKQKIVLYSGKTSE